MKKWRKEIAVIVAQILAFYGLPSIAGPTDIMGMVFLMLTATLLLALILGGVSERKSKFFYPFLAAVLFLPSVFVYYNESALVHSVWYLVAASVGLLIGALTRHFFNRKAQP